jgi:superfamily II DNA or RNA helicase
MRGRVTRSKSKKEEEEALLTEQVADKTIETNSERSIDCRIRPHLARKPDTD